MTRYDELYWHVLDLQDEIDHDCIFRSVRSTFTEFEVHPHGI